MRYFHSIFTPLNSYFSPTFFPSKISPMGDTPEIAKHVSPDTSTLPKAAPIRNFPDEVTTKELNPTFSVAGIDSI